MNRFADLLDALAYEPRRNAKLALMLDYFRVTPDPERGFALAALTGALSFKEAKPALIRQLAADRVDPVLFSISYDYVGDLSETVALIWPAPEGEREAAPGLADVVHRLATLPKRDLPAQLARWLDGLDETGRWALLKLITGGLRVGVSARLARSAVALLGPVEPDEVELVWHGLSAPYVKLFAWLEGHGPRPETVDPAPFRPVMLAHPLEESDLASLDPADFLAEWKWDGIRVQAVAGRDAAGQHVARLYARSGDEISAAFPDLVEALTFEGALDGELLIRRDGRIQSFNALQQRLNRKQASAKLMAEHPAHLRAYDLLADGDEDLRPLPFSDRRQRLEAFIARLDSPRVDLSPAFAVSDIAALTEARSKPVGAGPDAAAVEGLMLKRRDAPYRPGRPKGLWFKWKHDPRLVDCVLMYAQRGHGKRSSFYSDFTFGVWQGDDLVPVGKAYFGFTDAELIQLDRHVRKHTVNRFGPVREVSRAPGEALVLEIAFEGLQRSNRHRSGVAMRFPRINRIRWDKPAQEADRIETLLALVPDVDG